MSTIDVLNRLVAIHHRSLPTYLTYASPTWHRGNEAARETLAEIAADQRSLADRFGEMVVDLDGFVDYGAYPMVFTGYHDLSFEYLLTRLLELQQRDVSAISDCVDQLADAPLAKALAEEALGAAKGHLDSLRELQRAAAAG